MSKPLTFNCVLHASATPRKIAVTAYSGGIMRVPGWGPVLIDLGRLELPETIPLLQDHNNAIDAVVGSGTPEIRSGKLVISGTLAPGEAGQMVADLLVGGHPLQASVGVDPTETRNLQSGESVQANGQTFTAGRNGLTLIVAGRLREVSVTPLGCDDSTSVRIAARAARGNKMDFHDWLKDRGFDPTNLSDDQRDALLAGYNSEQALKANASGEPEAILQASLATARTGALRAAITRCAEQHPDKLDVVERLGREALTAGWSPERFELAVYRGTAVQIDNQPRAASRGLDRDVLQCALAMHVGLPGIEKEFKPDVCQRAQDLRARHVLDIAEH